MIETIARLAELTGLELAAGVDHLVDVRLAGGDEVARIGGEVDRPAKARQVNLIEVGGEPEAKPLKDALVGSGLLEQE